MIRRNRLLHFSIYYCTANYPPQPRKQNCAVWESYIESCYVKYSANVLNPILRFVMLQVSSDETKDTVVVSSQHSAHYCVMGRGIRTILRIAFRGIGSYTSCNNNASEQRNT